MLYNHLIDKLSILFVFCIVTLNNTVADSQNLIPYKISTSKTLISTQRNNLSLKLNELITPVLREAAKDIYFTQLNAKTSVLEGAQFKTKRYVHHINPLFRNYNYLRKTECPPLPDGTRRYFCPSTDRHGRWSCIKSDDLCDSVPQCPGSEDEDKTLCLFHRPVLNKLDMVSEKLGELASMISKLNPEEMSIPSPKKSRVFDPSLFKEAKDMDFPEEVFEIINERSSTKQRRRNGDEVASASVKPFQSPRVSHSTKKEPSIEEFAKMIGRMDFNRNIQDLSSF